MDNASVILLERDNCPPFLMLIEEMVDRIIVAQVCSTERTKNITSLESLVSMSPMQPSEIVVDDTLVF